MKVFYKNYLKYLDRVINFKSRIFLCVGVIFLIFVYFLPMWRITLYAQMFPEGLRVDIYSYKLLGHGTNESDLTEINILNHYIGMRALESKDFTEFKWIPLALGIFIILALRTAVIGRVSSLLDIFVMFIYFSIFSLGTFYHKLYTYGHSLDPKAAITVDPYTPPLFGVKKIANFTVHSWPAPGGIFMMLFALIIIYCLLTNYLEFKKKELK